MADKQQIPVFPFDKITKIEVSGGFYARLSQLLADYSTQTGIKDTIQFLEELKTREPKTTHEYHMLTLITLIATIEKQATADKLIVMADLPDQTPAKPLEN